MEEKAIRLLFIFNTVMSGYLVFQKTVRNMINEIPHLASDFFEKQTVIMVRWLNNATTKPHQDPVLPTKNWLRIDEDISAR